MLLLVVIYTLELLILLSSDILPYRDTFDTMHRYSWSLYHPHSETKSYGTINIGSAIV